MPTTAECRALLLRAEHAEKLLENLLPQHDAWAASAHRFKAERDEARAEMLRLRDALESIEGGHPCDEEHREMARAALRTTSVTPDKSTGST